MDKILKLLKEKRKIVVIATLGVLLMAGCFAILDVMTFSTGEAYEIAVKFTAGYAESDGKLGGFKSFKEDKSKKRVVSNPDGSYTVYGAGTGVGKQGEKLQYEFIRKLTADKKARNGTKPLRSYIKENGKVILDGNANNVSW